MPDFNQIRKELADARQQQDKTEDALLAAKQALKRVLAEEARLARIFDEENQEHKALRIALEKRRKKLEAEIKSLKDQKNQWQATASAQFAEFLFADPQSQVEQLRDDTPFLLFPVRLETRFKTFEGPDGTSNWLWVRIYPDDCLVDSFERELSESEILAAREFWANYRKSGGVTDQERGAWRSLVGSLGSGRAAWVVQEENKQLVLADPATPGPQKEKETDIILVIPTETAPTPAETTALRTYWSSAWLADGDKTLTDNAFAKLKSDLSISDDVAARLLVQWKPSNFTESPAPPLKKNEVGLEVYFLIFNKIKETPAKQTSWTRAPRSRVLPDRFVLILENYSGPMQEIVGKAIPSPLTVGVDPSLEKDEQLRQEAGELIVSEEMKWMTDFERSVEWGMGFKIQLTDGQMQQGFKRIIALGLRLSAGAEDGKALVEELFTHHKFGKSGFGLLPQGTPTNNVENESSGHSSSEDDDADASFDVFFGDKGDFTETSNWTEKTDGQWLAEWLGISSEALQSTLHADGRDQIHARAMNTALWPATMGYMMDTMMRQVFDANPQTANFDDNAVLFTRWFFTHFVSGRGSAPAIRIGKQPYGILPATNFFQMKGFDGDNFLPPAGIPLPQSWRSGMMKLYDILKKMALHWRWLSHRADFVGKNKDPHQVLLNVVGLHPSSVEYYQRYTLSMGHLWNTVKLNGAKAVYESLLGALNKTVPPPDLDEEAAGLDKDAMWLLHWLGYKGDEQPDVLEKVFLPKQQLMKGPVVDDRPLSETEPVREYTAPPAEGQPGKNYIQWLIDAARTSHETLRKEEGFLDGKPPTALLYLYLRHALMEGYADAGLRLYWAAQLMDSPALWTAKLDPVFIHVEGNKQASESRWSPLYKKEPQITGSADKLVIDHVTTQIQAQAIPTRFVNEQIAALERLQDAATAQLERAFSEHVDLVSYRLDAWLWGMKHFHLASMRFPMPVTGGPPQGKKQGIYLGAYGYLEEVRPEFKTLIPKVLQGELAQIFQKSGEPPLVTDSTNYGFIHAPSLNHGVTAALLRNAHKEYSTGPNKQTFAINLSSERVRLAVSFLEGMRNGQSLAALLGYQLERGLHDRYNESQNLFLDGVIYELRKAFPLYSNRLQTTKDDDAAIQAIEARNVVNGLDLVNAAKQHPDYPFGKSNLPNNLTQAEEGAINEEVRRLLDIHDAIADLAMAEGVHQVGLGNYERAAATLDAFGKATFPVEPEVAYTPRSGVTLTHRIGIHLETGLDPSAPAANPYNGIIPMTPRAQAEPALNKWLAGLFPDPATTGVQAAIEDGTSNTIMFFVTQKDLQLQAIDLLHMLDLENEQAMTELDDRIEHFLRAKPDAVPQGAITIEYTQPDSSGRITFFQLAPMLKSLRALAVSSRPLRSTDLALHEEATQEAENAVFFETQRPATLQTLITQLDTLKNGLAAGAYPAMQARYDDASLLREDIAALEAQIANPQPGDDVDALKATLAAKQAALAAKETEIIDNLDALALQAAGDFNQIARYGIPQAGTGWIRDEIKRLMNLMIAKVTELRDRWNQKTLDFGAKFSEYNALPVSTPDEVRYDRIAEMERLISVTQTVPGETDTPATVLTAVLAKKAAFDGKLGDVKSSLGTIPGTMADLRTDILILVADVPGFDLTPFDMADAEKQLQVYGEDLLKKVSNVAGVLQKQVDAANAKMADHADAADAKTAVAALSDAAKIIFGDGFQLIPSFALSATQADELANATAASADLVKFQSDDLPADQRVDFPVDHWLYGAARVREKLKHWESLNFLAEAFGNTPPSLQPVQLPYQPNDRWLALQFRKPGESEEDFKVDADRLLYTSAWAVPFDKTAPQCGLLVDEWTEVIPTKTETTGLAFHFDRPSSEPPQTMLLAMPSIFRGHWEWSDLVSSIIETFEMARLRAVEPTMVDDLPYARFLPATMMTVTTYLLTISTNLSVNNQMYAYIKE